MNTLPEQRKPDVVTYIDAMHTMEAWMHWSRIDDDAYRTACGREVEYAVDQVIAQFDIPRTDLMILGGLARMGFEAHFVN